MLAGGGTNCRSGGVGTLILYLTAHWSRSPNPPQVHVLDTRGNDGPAAAIWRFALALLHLTIALGLRRTDLVHVHMTTRGSALRKTILCGVALAWRTPFIINMHGADFAPFYRRLPAICRYPLRAILRRARRILVVGEAWRDFLIDEVGLPAQQILVVANGVPCHAPPDETPAGGVPHILFLGRLGARKGVPELVSALGSPKLARRAWHATLAGDGDTARARAQVEAYGLTSSVALPGWADRATSDRLLARAHMLVLPSHHEAMPMAVLEALAAGVAVITTPVGAVPEFLTHGQTALLVPPGDSAALAAAITRLLDDPQERRRLATNGHRLFLARFDIAVAADTLMALYRATTGRPNIA